MSREKFLTLSATLVAVSALCHSAAAKESETAKPEEVETPAASSTQKRYPPGDISQLGIDKKKPGDENVSPISGKTYALKWIDDFEGDSLNTDNWVYETRNLNKWQIFVKRPQNVEVKDGNLHLIVRKEEKEYAGDIEPWHTEADRVTSHYTAGGINSNGKQAFQYGRFEIRAKLPYSYSLWPAFWTMGANRGWPWGGEVDICEFVGGFKDGRHRDAEYHSCLHWADPSLPNNLAWGTNKEIPKDAPDSLWNSTDTKMVHGATFQLPSFKDSGGQKLADDWYVFGMEWTEKHIKFYCNDAVFQTVDITKESMREAYHQPHFIILNNFLGGEWPGYPNEKTVLPQSFIIDWVKVWQ